MRRNLTSALLLTTAGLALAATPANAAPAPAGGILGEDAAIDIAGLPLSDLPLDDLPQNLGKNTVTPFF